MRGDGRKWARDKFIDRLKLKSQEAVNKFLKESPKCGFCERPFLYSERRKKFCNHSCCSKYHNTKRYGGLKPTHCTCGLPLLKDRKYCDTCIERGRLRINDISKAKTPAVIKRIITEQRGHKCESCKNTEWCGKPIPLELDHISGDSDDNSEDNLRLLCPNCHAQTPTYKAKNKGKGSSRQVKRTQKKREKSMLP